MQITKEQVVILYRTVNEYQAQEKKVQEAMLANKDYKGASSAKFKSVLAKLKIVLQPEYSAIEEVGKGIGEVIKDYQEELNKLNNEYGTQDPRNGLWNFPVDKFPIYKEKAKELEVKYKDQLDGYNQQLADYEKFLKETVELNFEKVSTEQAPEWLSSEVFTTLLEFGILV